MYHIIYDHSLWHDCFFFQCADLVLYDRVQDFLQHLMQQGPQYFLDCWRWALSECILLPLYYYGMTFTCFLIPLIVRTSGIFFLFCIFGLHFEPSYLYSEFNQFSLVKWDLLLLSSWFAHWQIMRKMDSFSFSCQMQESKLSLSCGLIGYWFQFPLTFSVKLMSLYVSTANYDWSSSTGDW